MKNESVNMLSFMMASNFLQILASDDFCIVFHGLIELFNLLTIHEIYVINILLSSPFNGNPSKDLIHPGKVFFGLNDGIDV